MTDIDTNELDLSGEKPWTSKDNLEYLYWDVGLDQQEVADTLGCSRVTIVNWMDELDVPARSNHTSDEAQYKSEEWLREQYVENGRSALDIADECGVTTPPIYSKLEDFGIETRSTTGVPKDEIYKSKSWLRDQYVSKDKTAREIGDIVSRDMSTILHWIHKHEIPTRPPAPRECNYASFFTTKAGYESWTARSTDGDLDSVDVHRLFAVSEFGFDAVCGMVVHHKCHIPWLTISGEVEPLTAEEHGRHHQAVQAGDKPIPSGLHAD